MLTFFSVIHVVLCVFMIFVILLQPGKDAGMGSALGGGATQTAFGGRGAVTFLSKVTAVCAIAFFVTSLGLSFVGLRSSVITDAAAEAASKSAPPAPGDAPPATAPTPTGELGQAKPDDVTAPITAPDVQKDTQAAPSKP